MQEMIINIITIISYSFFTIENLLQALHVYKRKTSGDILIFGLIIRITAINAIFLKLLLLGDWYLIIGQLGLIISGFLYFFIVLFYRKK